MQRLGIFAYILLFILRFQSAFSSDDSGGFSEMVPQIASPTVVGGVVDALSGQFILPDVQLKEEGPAPYAYGWSYYNGKSGQRGHFANGFDCDAHAHLHRYTISSRFDALDAYIGPNRFHFLGKRGWQKNSPFVPRGWCNIFAGEISGRMHPHNMKLDYENSKHLGRKYNAALTLPHGAVQYYDLRAGRDVKCPYINAEVLTNGNCIHYVYGNNQEDATKIYATNRDGSKKFWEINVNIKPDQQSSHRISDNRGNWVNYTAEDGWFDGNKATILKRIDFCDRPYIVFEGAEKKGIFDKKSWTEILVKRVKRPNHRMVEVEYDKIGKVRELRQHLRRGYSPVIYRFEHHDRRDKFWWSYPDHGWTDVFDGNGHKCIYRYSMKDRIPDRFKSIEQFNKSDHLIKMVHFCWGDNEPIPSHHIMFKAEVGRGNSIIEGYEYDDDKNVTVHSIYGNLKKEGGCKPYNLSDKPFCEPEKYSKSNFDRQLRHLDCYRRYFTYHSNQFHFLASVRDDFGNYIKYDFIAGTDLIWKRILVDGQHDAKVQIYDYNNDRVLIKEETITPVSRTIKEITPVENPGCHGFGQPEIVTEYAVENNGDKTLLKETRFAYTVGDKIAKEEVYDCNGDYCYAKEYFYDDRRRLIAEIDPAGQEIRYEYDENFNKIGEEVVGSGLKVCYDYDIGDRMIAKRLVAESGEVIETRYEYDVMNNCTKIIDPFKGTASYSYDCQGNVVKEVLDPLITLKGGKKLREYTHNYDGIGNRTLTRGPRNALTLATWTSTGLPLKIQSPDGRIEKYLYREDGKLLEKHIMGGESLYFVYDNLGHVVSKRTFDETAGVDFIEEWQYAADFLVQSLDKNGNVIHFEYDKAGRLIKEVAFGTAGEKKRVTYGYDTLGRRYSVTRWLNDAEYICEETKTDYVGREILKRQTNEKGHILSFEEYEYDWQGNVTAKKRHIDENTTSVEFFEYNAFGDLVCHTDPLGNQTKTQYDYHATDKLKRKGILKITCDPLGKVIKTLTNAQKQVLETHEFDPDGNLINYSGFFYDVYGNKTDEIHEVFQNNEKVRNYVVARTYCRTNLLKSETEQPGTEDEKKTVYNYDKYGRLSEIIQPNGVILNLLTNKDQLVLQRSSSDGTIDEEWNYDNNLNPVLVRSGSTYTEREYDSFGRMVYERLANGLELSYEYDSLDRIQKIHYPDGGYAHYEWSDGRFSHVRRFDADGYPAYHYSQGGYNWLGRHRSASYPGAVNIFYYKFDLMGRPTSLKSKHFSQYDITYDEVGNLVSYTQEDVFGKTDCAFTYDPWYHLASESGRFDRTYAYDSLGNRIAKNKSDYSVNPLNQVKKTEGTVYEYDKNGCLIQKTEADLDYRFAYDGLNRLTRITKTCEEQEEKYFFYDPFNRRIAESPQPINDPQLAEKRYLFDDEKEIAVFDSDGNASQLRILLPGESEIGATVSIELNGVAYSPINSVHGHICGLATRPGELVGAWYFSAFGEEVALEDSIACSWRSWNKPTEELTGYVHFGRRYLDTALGRWVTPDPEGFIDGPNLYAYVHNKPLTYFDHYGLCIRPRRPLTGMRRGIHDWRHSEERMQGMSMMDYLCKYSYSRGYVNLYYGQPRVITLKDGLPMIKDRVDPNFKINERKNKTIVHMNGIWTTPEDAMHQLYTLCKKGNCNGYLVYNPDHNWKLTECIAQLFGYNTPTTDLLRNLMTELVAKNPNIHILSSFHSQGGIVNHNTAKQLTPEVMKHIYFFGIAPANIVPDDNCLGSFNLKSKWDIVPYASLNNLIKNSHIVKTLRHKPCTFLKAHEFDNPVYDWDKNRIINEFLGK
jgi:RHS repeat-associated protein